jgi:hypothetical protein
MKRSKRAGIAVVAVALALLGTACGPVGGPNNIVFNEVRSIGQYRSPQGSGGCNFGADVRVDKSAGRVEISALLTCVYTGSSPVTCYYDVDVFRGSVHYRVDAPEAPCDTGGPATHSFPCHGDCTGTWTADAGVLVRGSPGTTWRTKDTSACDPWRSGGTEISCGFIYDSKTVT